MHQLHNSTTSLSTLFLLTLLTVASPLTLDTRAQTNLSLPLATSPPTNDASHIPFALSCSSTTTTSSSILILAVPEPYGRELTEDQVRLISHLADLVAIVPGQFTKPESVVEDDAFLNVKLTDMPEAGAGVGLTSAEVAKCLDVLSQEVRARFVVREMKWYLQKDMKAFVEGKIQVLSVVQ